MRAKAGLDALARAAASPGDGRTADQRRADVLVDVLTAGADGPGAAAYSSGVRGGLGVRRLPEVVVTVSAETLLGLSEDPGHLSGYGPIVADLARDVAARGTWRCAIVDGTHGTLLGLGRTTFTPDYRPGQPLVDHVAVRDQTCSFPGCHQAARRCDADHRRPHPAGATCECNIGSLCRHHHRLKHRSGFEVETSSDGSDPPGTLIWTTPTGRTYSRPPTRMPAATPDRSPPAGPVTHRAREEVEEEDPPPF